MSWDDSRRERSRVLFQASDLAELREARRELRKSRGSAGKRGMAEVGLDADWLKVVDVEFDYQCMGSDKKSGRIPWHDQCLVMKFIMKIADKIPVNLSKEACD